MPIERVILDTGGRRRVLEYHPELLAPSYEPPKVNLQATLQRQSDLIAELQRGGGG